MLQAQSESAPGLVVLLFLAWVPGEGPGMVYVLYPLTSSNGWTESGSF